MPKSNLLRRSKNLGLVDEIYKIADIGAFIEGMGYEDLETVKKHNMQSFAVWK